MAHKQPFGIVDVVLIVVIIALTGALWYVIWAPGRQLAYQEDMKWESRARMSALRSAQIEYFNHKQTYTSHIDSLLLFMQTEVSPGRRDSLFVRLHVSRFSFDSLRHTPMSLLPYEIVVDDTSLVPRYRISDPDGFGVVSSISNPDEHNKASWEQ
jgi:hypothetical protein